MTAASPDSSSPDAASPESTVTARPAAEPPNYLTEEGSTLRSWLLTHDHKRIAILYALTITVFFFIGGRRRR